jgi:23S rRNA (guanosine2251-2'-O)-methyltransferase
MRKPSPPPRPNRPPAKPDSRGPAPTKPRPVVHATPRVAPAKPRPVAHVIPRGAPAEAGDPWIWGRHAVLAALANPDRKILRLVATEDVAAEFTEAGNGPAPQRVTKEELHRLLPPGAVHQGVALMAKPLRPVAIEDLIDGIAEQEAAVIVALDQVTDPHNIGAVMRSAAAFGAAAVIVPDRNAPEVSGTLAKAASGAVEQVPLIRVVNLNRSLDALKKAGFWVVGLEGDAEQTLASHKLSGKVCLVLGSEGEGLRRLTREACDLMARLPTKGPIASLNVSNAAAIALYEVVRTD